MFIIFQVEYVHNGKKVKIDNPMKEMEHTVLAKAPKIKFKEANSSKQYELVMINYDRLI